MANKRVRLVRCCVVNGSVKPVYCKPEITGKGQVSSEWVLFKGKKYKVPASEGRWLIRWEDGSRPRWQTAGTGISDGQLSPIIPTSAGSRARAAGADVIYIPQGTGQIPDSLQQVEPRPYPY